MVSISIKYLEHLIYRIICAIITLLHLTNKQIHRHYRQSVNTFFRGVCRVIDVSRALIPRYHGYICELLQLRVRSVITAV